LQQHFTRQYRKGGTKKTPGNLYDLTGILYFYSE
jgi:hypothetical protein